MDVHQLLDKIGPNNADMLLCNDAWLQREYRLKAIELGETLSKLRLIELIRNTKKHLQQTNKVAVQRLLRDDDGKISDVTISIMDLPDATNILNDVKDTLDVLNCSAQLQTWHDDGYDIRESYNLR